MRVFRVGHATRTRHISKCEEPFPLGPYNGLSWDERPEGLKEMVSAHSGYGTEKHHPSPMFDDDLMYVDLYEVCGFDSMDALLSWFESWLKVLDEAGFRVWVYEVPDADVRVGRLGQALFRASSAVPMSTERLPLEPEQLALF